MTTQELKNQAEFDRFCEIAAKRFPDHPKKQWKKIYTESIYETVCCNDRTNQTFYLAAFSNGQFVVSIIPNANSTTDYQELFSVQMVFFRVNNFKEVITLIKQLH